MHNCAFPINIFLPLVVGGAWKWTVVVIFWTESQSSYFLGSFLGSFLGVKPLPRFLFWFFLVFPPYYLNSLDFCRYSLIAPVFFLSKERFISQSILNPFGHISIYFLVYFYSFVLGLGLFLKYKIPNSYVLDMYWQHLLATHIPIPNSP